MPGAADPELEKLRFEVAYADARSKLQDELAAIDAELKRLHDPSLRSAGAVVLYRRYYEREREKVLLRIDLLELPKKILELEWNCKLRCSPEVQRQHERNFQKRLAGYALGSGGPMRRYGEGPTRGPSPGERAKHELSAAQGMLRNKQQRLQELCRSDAEWAELLSNTPAPAANFEKSVKEDATSTAPDAFHEPGGPVGRRPNQGRIDLGKTINNLYQELRRLKTYARGRRKTETYLRQKFPDFQLWKEIDSSSSLPTCTRQNFFRATLDSYRQQEFMIFIGNIVALEGDTAYKYLKEYRDHAGLKRKRRPSKAASKAVPKAAPKSRP